MQVMDGYIRVSRVMGREGDSYMSPSIQEDDIKRWAEARGVSLGKIAKDEDVSGGKAIAARGLGGLIDRIEAGVSSGVIVNHLDRFGRDALDAAIAIKRIHDAGGRLVATSTGTDSSQPDAKMILNFYFMMAEAYLDRTKASWDATKRRNVEERGLHVCASAPFGYQRVDKVEGYEGSRDARLVVVPQEAEIVRLAFKQRADGQPFANINRACAASLGRPLSRNFARRTIDNRVYLGEARATVRAKEGPGTEQIVKEGAHEAIVTPELYAAANRTQSKSWPLDGSLSEQALLAGVVRCASCGHRMHVRGKTRKGKRQAFYHCSRGSTRGDCAAPSSAYVNLVDEHVLWVLSQDESGAVSAVGGEEQRYLEAREHLREAEDDLASLVADRGDLSLKTWQSMVVDLERAVEDARADLYSIPDPGIEDAPVVMLGGRLWAYKPWGEDRDADRRTLRRYVGSVEIKSCGMNGRWTPIDQRVSVTWADGSEPQIPSAPTTVQVPA
jgi:DNA invertase Pin-like site-specific DNA recombinase